MLESAMRIAVDPVLTPHF